MIGAQARTHTHTDIKWNVASNLELLHKHKSNGSKLRGEPYEESRNPCGPGVTNWSLENVYVLSLDGSVASIPSRSGTRTSSQWLTLILWLVGPPCVASDLKAVGKDVEEGFLSLRSATARREVSDWKSEQRVTRHLSYDSVTCESLPDHARPLCASCGDANKALPLPPSTSRSPVLHSILCPQLIHDRCEKEDLPLPVSMFQNFRSITYCPCNI